MKIPNASTPWYKQFWPWFLIFLPSTVVVASMYTIYLAITNADSLIVDDYYKKGLEINRNLQKIEYAKKIGLTGSFIVNNKNLVLNVRVLKNNIELAPTLTMQLVHPTDASKDFSISLVQSAATNKSNALDSFDSKRYVNFNKDEEILKINKRAWYVRLVSPDNIWQLNGKAKGNNKIINLYAD